MRGSHSIAVSKLDKWVDWEAVISEWSKQVVYETFVRKHSFLFNVDGASLF